MDNHKVYIQPITAVHVGSGDTLVRNIDFIDKKGKIYIIDINKIGEKLPNQIEKLTEAIMRVELKQFLEKHEIDLKSVSKRVVGNRGCKFGNRDNKLRQMMTNAAGLPYIPGSTIKGALRTAVLATLARRQGGADCIFPLEQFEEKHFGRIQSDWWRFIRVGDAVFETKDLIADTIIRMKRNKKANLVEHDNMKTFVEALSYEESQTEFTLSFDIEGYNRARNHHDLRVPQMPQEVQSVKALFRLVNEHTRFLIENEKDIWKSVAQADEYLHQLDDILDNITNCKKDECVLRLGFASGWRFISGAWSEGGKYPKGMARMGNKPNDKIIPPITRSVDDEKEGGIYKDNVLGFVKLQFV